MRCRRTFVAVVPAALAVWVAALSIASADTTKTTVMVPMRDGVRLSTTVYLPSGEGRWPALLIRTPYSKDGRAADMIAAMAMLNGYALVGQDMRGRYASEGEDFLVFQHDGWGEHRDGFDTVAWIAEQPWLNGKVATFGASAMGIVQNLMAPTQPPALVCQHTGVAFSSMYHQTAYQGGAWRKALVERWLRGNKFDPRSIETFHGHPDYDEFWDQFNPEARAEKINVPIMFVGGWYDIFNQGTIDMFKAVNERGGPRARGNCRLVMEAFGHGASNDLKFKRIARPANTQEAKWANLWVKRDGKGIDEIPVVQYYVLGDPETPGAPGCEWRSADAWPIPATETPVYFHKGGGLDWAPPAEESATRSYMYDPKNPVPTHGGQNLQISKGPKDQRPVENRPDVLLFTSPELTKPLEVTGRVKAKLWVASSALDTDFTVKLTDVYPDGRSMLLLDGILRMRHRNTFEKSEMMEPGKVYEIEVDLWSTSIIFNTGHRVRVAVSSSNSPRFEPNPNTGRPSGMDDETQIARNTLYLDASHPSHIILPVPK